jgi:hypothetical protein
LSLIRRDTGDAPARPRAAGPAARARKASLATDCGPSTCAKRRTPLLPAPTRHIVDSPPGNHPPPQPADIPLELRPREPSGGATRPPRRDRGDQPPTGRRYRTTHLPFLNRASNDFAFTGLPGLPSLVFVCVVIVRVIVRVFVRMFVCLCMHACLFCSIACIFP